MPRDQPARGDHVPQLHCSDGDRQMLGWTTSGPKAGTGLIVHHTDGDREYACDRGSAVDHLDKELDEAEARGWVIANMQRGWKVIFPFEP